MTDFELSVWAATYGAVWSAGDENPDERSRAAHAFESATYAVLELRRFKIEPVFGVGSESGKVEAYVLDQLRARP